MGTFRFWAVSVLAIGCAACQSTVPTVVPTPGPAQSLAPSPAVSLIPSASPQGVPSTSIDGGATAFSGAPEPGGGELGILKGQVFDARGGAVPDDSFVTLKSLDPSRPYTATVKTNGGAYVANAVPLNVQLEVSATHPGWTTRTRVLVLRKADPRLTIRNVYNFGGPANADDPAGPAFFITDYPEIERVEPVDQDTSLPNESMKFKLVVSEPLDAANQRRLASAFLLIPNNQEAMSENDTLPDETASTTELTGLRGGTDPTKDSIYRYRQNAGFLNGLAVSNFKWDSDNRSATFTLNAPVKTGFKKEGEYAFVLVHQDDQTIVDAAGLALGMDANHKFGGYIKGGIIFSAIKRPGLVLASSVGGTEEDRWGETHQTWTKFSVKKDTVAPKLVSVLARRNYVDDAGTASDRVEFLFSEPMVAFPNAKSVSLLSLNNYIISTAVSEAEMGDHNLGNTNKAKAISTLSTFSAVRDAIKGVNGMVADADSNSSGDFLIKLGVADPKLVIIQMPAGSLPLDANFIKAYVGADNSAPSGASKSVADPAGNPMDPAGCTAVGPIY